MKKSLAFYMLLFWAILAASPVWASTWTQVTRFTGSTSQTTDYFTVSHAEWRVNWTYTPDPQYPQYAGFYLNVYNQNKSEWPVAIIQSGNTTTQGTTYVHNLQGTFYCEITITSITGYTITIEQDLTSVPEYGNVAFILAMLPVSLVVLFVVRKKAVR